MDYYPIMLDVKGRPVLVVGGGSVAERKVRTLLQLGAAVTVISSQVTSFLDDLCQNGAIVLHMRSYREGDLEGAELVFAATDDQEVNIQIAAEARARKIYLNVADTPELCDFILPAIFNQGDLVFAISTGGKSPALAKKIREDLPGIFGPEYRYLTELLGAVREKILEAQGLQEEHARKLNRFVRTDILEFIRQGRKEEIERLLQEIFGQEYCLKELGLKDFPPKGS